MRINVIVYSIQGALPGFLTTDHAQSSYGRPVLIVAGVSYGPDDALPGHPESGPQLARDTVMARANSLIPEFDPMSTTNVDCTADNEAEQDFQSALTAFRSTHDRTAQPVAGYRQP
jgi:hypothetical protein